MKVYILSNKKLVRHELPNSLEEFYSLEYQPDTLSGIKFDENSFVIAE